MSYSLGPTLAVGGEKEYMAAMKNVRESMKYVKAEADAAISVYGKNEKSVQSLTTQINNSKKAFDVQKTAVKAAEDALERMRNNGVDESSTAYKRMEANLNTAKAALNNTSREIDEQEKELKQATNAADEMAKAEKTMGNHAKTAGTQMKGVGTQAKGLKGKIKDFVKSSVGQMATFAGAFALAVKAVKALANLLGDSADWGKEVSSLAQTTGMTVESYQQWDFILKKVNYSMEQASGDFAALGEKAMDAALGVGEGAEMFGLLGVKVTDTSGKLKSQEQIFEDVIKALQGMEDVTKRNAIASALMSTTGEQLVPVLNMTTDEVEKLKKEHKNAGMVIDTITVKALETLDDKLKETSAVTEAESRKVAASLASVADVFSTAWQKTVKYVTPEEVVKRNLRLLGANAEQARELSQAYTTTQMALYASGLEEAAFFTELEKITNYLQAQGVPEVQALTQAQVLLAEQYTLTSYIQEQMRDAQAAWDEQVNASLEAYISKQAEYEAAVTQTSEAYLSDMGGLFDGFNAELAGSQKELDEMTKSLIDNLESQVDGIEGWADEMDKLSKRGIDEGLLQELRDMGPEAYAEIQALNNATDEQLAEYEGLYKTRSEAATAAAKTALEPMAGDVADALDAAEKVIEDRNAAMKKLGTNLAKGIGDGIDAGTWYVEREVRDVINTAIAVAKKAGKIQSPSKLMSDEVGLYLGEGVGVGFIDSIKKITPDIEDAMRSMAFNLSGSIPSSLGAMSASAPATVVNTTREIIRDSGFQPQFNGPVYVNTGDDIKTLAQKLGYEYKRALAAQGA